VLEIRFHGRGGQGVVVASEVLAVAFFLEGRFVQSFPAFGAERRGAPVAAFTRVDRAPIRARYQIYKPDHVVVLSEKLLQTTDVTNGLKPGGWVILNTDRHPSVFNEMSAFRVATVDADRVAVQYGLGSPMAPIVNTAILGAFARCTCAVRLQAVCEAIGEKFAAAADANASACREAFAITSI
jgi:2-oxoisovalerate ferredoxin oxidoreductase gamma subunit